MIDETNALMDQVEKEIPSGWWWRRCAFSAGFDLKESAGALARSPM
jgi:hypothetical protein